ncbi:MAG TPA: hypothetical protein VKD67_00955, partial [Acidimicrobiales bacterium]|nr:hypothetical protein [Acidimicrobiales bacterium]
MMSSTDGQAVIDAVAARAPVDERGLLPTFLRRYYERVAADDLRARPPDELLAAALAHWTAGTRRPPGQPVLRIYNPDGDPNGWPCAHTVIDIVTDDMPFLVDSVTMVLAARDLGIHSIVHPMLPIRRDAAGELTGIGDGHPREAWIHLEVERQSGATARAELEDAIAGALHDVRLVVDDWMDMRERAMAIADEVRRGVPVPSQDVEDTADLLRWMAAENFTFLGFRDYELA